MEKFDLDNQTIKDLEIFVDDKSVKSIFSYYNQTKTFGGKRYLHQLMKIPISDIEELKQRNELTQFLVKSDFRIKINSSQFELIEHYLRLNISPLRNNFFDALFNDISYKISPNNNYYIIKSGVQQLVFLFNHLKEKFELLSEEELPQKLNLYWNHISDLFQELGYTNSCTLKQKISFSKLNKLDNLFRKKCKTKLYEVIQLIYELDAFISLAKVARQKNLGFPDYLNAGSPLLLIDGLYHPLLKNPVSYSIKINESTNLCFLTGPNMAGKSTFLKSVGLSIYLAHVGLPIPAKKMTTSIYHGIVSTINLSDDLNKGYSHFYSEVNRIKEIAIRLKKNKRLFVIFDELFRGTNLKDAYEASLLIIKSFAKISDCTFFISTHITEVAEKLTNLSNIQFKYFDSRLVNNIPIYEYKLENGISSERLGLYIIKNEKIIDILDSIKKN